VGGDTVIGRFDVLTAVLLESQVLWEVTLCNWKV
jgi:hypothetical protein